MSCSLRFSCPFMRCFHFKTQLILYPNTWEQSFQYVLLSLACGKYWERIFSAIIIISTLWKLPFPPPNPHPFHSHSLNISTHHAIFKVKKMQQHSDKFQYLKAVIDFSRCCIFSSVKLLVLDLANLFNVKIWKGTWYKPYSWGAQGPHKTKRVFYS